ncbi:MAG: tetratricopeptide repeat protein [Rhodospirillales bacterium]|nr:tetratricopeptide repeat protein [Rhodospirillales bacterium]
MDVTFRCVSGPAALGEPRGCVVRKSSSLYLLRRYAVLGVLVFSFLGGFFVLANAPDALAFQSAIGVDSVSIASDTPARIGASEVGGRPHSHLIPVAGDVSDKALPVSDVPVGAVPSQTVPVNPSATPPDVSSGAAPFPTPSGEEGASVGMGVPASSADEGDDLYYDSLPLPPTGTMAKTAGPRKVNPVLEPAQKFVIVKKEHDSDAFESLIVSANRALVLGRYDSALDMFTQMYKKNPRDPRVLMGRASALQHLGRREAAIGAYDALLKVDPSNAEAQINKAGLTGVEYPAVALRTLLDLREKFPGNAGLSAQIGLMQARLGNDAEAFQYLGTAASLEPGNAEHIYNMAVIADRMGNAQKAIPLYEQALQMDGRDTQGERISRDVVYARLSVLRASKK